MPGEACWVSADPYLCIRKFWENGRIYNQTLNVPVKAGHFPVLHLAYIATTANGPRLSLSGRKDTMCRPLIYTRILED